MDGTDNSDTTETFWCHEAQRLEAARDFWKYLALVLLGLMLLAAVMRYAPMSQDRQSPFIAEPE